MLLFLAHEPSGSFKPLLAKLFLMPPLFPVFLHPFLHFFKKSLRSGPVLSLLKTPLALQGFACETVPQVPGSSVAQANVPVGS
jgi:hypothetical protein